VALWVGPGTEGYFANLKITQYGPGSASSVGRLDCTSNSHYPHTEGASWAVMAN